MSARAAAKGTAGRGGADPAVSAEPRPSAATTTDGVTNPPENAQQAESKQPVPKVAKVLLSILAREGALENPTREACEGVLARVQSALQGMSQAKLRESCEALQSYLHRKYPVRPT